MIFSLAAGVSRCQLLTSSCSAASAQSWCDHLHPCSTQVSCGKPLAERQSRVLFPLTAPRRLGGPTFLAMLDGLAPQHKTIPFTLAQRVGFIGRRIREVTSRLDAICTLVTLDL
jgi:hypothetical protein